MCRGFVAALAAAWLAGCADTSVPGADPDSAPPSSSGAPAATSSSSGGPPAETSNSGSAGEESGADAAPTGIRYLTERDDEAADGFARAMTPRSFEFPEDHASHPEFRSEWWYFTGNVFAASGRHYGFEVTFFRYALAADAPRSPSSWSTNQFWMAHFAVTDTRERQFIAEERLTRGALGLAGTAQDPFRVWVEDWSLTAQPEGGEGIFALEAAGERTGIELELRPLKPPAMHGDRGLDAKGPEPGNASYYYSWPRIAASGTVTVDGAEQAVEGYAWMDREWSTSALSADLEGWDWFALQLSDGRDLMVYRLRRNDGTASPFSGGSLIDAAGNRRALQVEDIDIEALAYWQSARSGARYPVAWRLRVPSEELDLEVRPYLEAQEIDLSVRYWEGAVRIEGRSAGVPVTGNGYLELAGY